MSIHVLICPAYLSTYPSYLCICLSMLVVQLLSEVKWKGLSRVWLFVTPWTIQSQGILQAEYWSGYLFPSAGDLPNPWIKSRSPTLQADSLPAEPAAKLCPALCGPMDCSMPVSSVLHYFSEFAQMHIHWVSEAIQPSHHPLSPPFSSCPPSFPAWGSFPVSWLFTSGGPGIGASTSASVLSVNTQGWFPLGLTDSMSLQFKGL